LVNAALQVLESSRLIRRVERDDFAIEHHRHSSGPRPLLKR